MKMSEDPAAQVVVDTENPWPGLDFFAEKSRAFFHGRDAEAGSVADNGSASLAHGALRSIGARQKFVAASGSFPAAAR